MAGLYIHIPFCRSKCDYCDFFSMPLATACRQGGHAVYARYVDALLKEFELREWEVSEPIKTVYIGGGTPTALPGALLVSLIREIVDRVERKNCGYKIEELTIEGNPEDVSREALHALKDAGVNRVSIGIQSFDSTQLHDAGRKHSVEASLKALEILAEDGINFNADLIYGLPGQSLASWRQQLLRLLEFRPNHLSAYLLSFEPGTKLFARRENGTIVEADEQLAVEMYRNLCEEMARAGYEHYEISNFALPGCRSRHNSSYWNLTPYLGLGCSAHSFDGVVRRYNPSNLNQYLGKVERGEVAALEDEEVSIDRINDYIITSLRTSDGLSLDMVNKKWGADMRHTIFEKCMPFLQSGRLQEASAGSFKLIIPEEFWLTADNILRELLLDK